jgi:hypothetical protein
LIYQKAVKAVTRKSRCYDAEAKTGITKTDCTKSQETQGTKHTHKHHMKVVQKYPRQAKSCFEINITHSFIYLLKVVQKYTGMIV